MSDDSPKYRDPDDIGRIMSIIEPHENFEDYHYTNSTDAGHYYVVLRTWEHPKIDDATTVSLRYCYLDKGGDSAAWTDMGMNMRAVDLVAFLDGLAAIFGSTADDYRGQ